MRDNDAVEVADVDVAAVARLLAEPARAAMLTVLLDGRAHPAGMLAAAAGIGRPAASSHLQQLVTAGLVRVRPTGRHRYHSLAGPEVARAVEALAAIAPPIPVRSLTQSRTARRLATARTCYDHLAGRAGVRLRHLLLDHRLLTPTAAGGDREGRAEAGYAITRRGTARLLELGLDPAELAGWRRRFARDCPDWTERTPHLAGALPAALLTALTDRRWITRKGGREVDISPAGWAAILGWLRCDDCCHPAPGNPST